MRNAAQGSSRTEQGLCVHAQKLGESSENSSMSKAKNACITWTTILLSAFLSIIMSPRDILSGGRVDDEKICFIFTFQVKEKKYLGNLFKST